VNSRQERSFFANRSTYLTQSMFIKMTPLLFVKLAVWKVLYKYKSSAVGKKLTLSHVLCQLILLLLLSLIQWYTFQTINNSRIRIPRGNFH